MRGASASVRAAADTKTLERADSQPIEQREHVISGIAIVALAMFSGPVVRIIFGASFHQAEPLLWLYAATTGLYALSVVMMAYEMSRKIANTGWLQLLISGITIAGITLFHQTLHQVIVVQLVLMVVLLFLVSLPFLRGSRNKQENSFQLEEAA